jgi:glucosamine-6-phosphate deaminase
VLDALGVPAERHLAFDGLASDITAEARRVSATLRDWGGIDLCLLGLGANGHVAFNEPGSPPDAPARVVTLTEETRARNFPRRGGGVAAHAPTHALTLGLAEILAAREIVLLVTGRDKRAVLERVVRGPVTPDVPASVLAARGAVTVLTDAGPALPRPRR